MQHASCTRVSIMPPFVLYIYSGSARGSFTMPPETSLFRTAKRDTCPHNQPKEVYQHFRGRLRVTNGHGPVKHGSERSDWHRDSKQQFEQSGSAASKIFGETSEPLNALKIPARLSFLSNLDVHVNNALTHNLTKSRRASDSTQYCWTRLAPSALCTPAHQCGRCQRWRGGTKQGSSGKVA